MYKIFCKECSKEHITRNSKTKFCCEKCRTKYNKKHRGHKQTCEQCNGTFVKYREKRFCSNECLLKHTSEMKETRKIARLEQIEKEKKDKSITKLFNALSNMVGKVRKCSCCGKDYIFKVGENGTKYCSDECSVEGKKKTRTRTRMDRDKRWSKNGKVDYSVTLERLHERDNGNCHICNKKVDYNDYQTTEEGHFIAGNSYPSIDHVVPIAKGGLHRWDNVKLAHRNCNSRKSDNEVEFQMFLEI